MVQRRAARWTLKRYHNTSSVLNMLQDLGWRSLEQRRADARLFLFYKIHRGHVPINGSKYLRPMTRRSRHSHNNSFIPLSTSTSSHRLSFYPRTITQWNSLPQCIFDTDDLNSFKHSVSLITHSSVNYFFLSLFLFVCFFFFFFPRYFVFLYFIHFIGIPLTPAINLHERRVGCNGK